MYEGRPAGNNPKKVASKKKCRPFFGQQKMPYSFYLHSGLTDQRETGKSNFDSIKNSVPRGKRNLAFLHMPCSMTIDIAWEVETR